MKPPDADRRTTFPFFIIIFWVDAEAGGYCIMDICWCLFCLEDSLTI